MMDEYTNTKIQTDKYTNTNRQIQKSKIRWTNTQIQKYKQTNIEKIRQARVVSNSQLYDGRSTNKWTQTGKQANKYENANIDTYTTGKY